MAYSALPVRPAIGRTRICGREQSRPDVELDSPALQVMTDLTKVPAAVVPPHETMQAAHDFMMQRGVRMLLVVDGDGHLAGLITATDILGEKPVELVHDRRMRHADITVADIMTPASELEAFDMHDVVAARVGQVVESLQQARRHHALVVQATIDGAGEVRGLFSLSQIARQLGTPLQLPQQAKSFAELEQALT